MEPSEYYTGRIGDVDIDFHSYGDQYWIDEKAAYIELSINDYQAESIVFKCREEVDYLIEHLEKLKLTIPDDTGTEN